MIRTCKNCAGKLTYDIGKRGLSCVNCGSLFTVEEYESDSEESSSTLPFIKSNDMVNCKIFSCSSCGAEVSVTDNEASTFCIYCGNPTIIFSRVGKFKKPDIIVPFKITKEEALDIVRTKLKKGILIPKTIKNFEPELLRGIYIPYHVTKVEYDSSMILSSVQKSGKHSHTYFHKRSGYITLPWVTTDASSTLSDSTSQRLEPYIIKESVPFDEDYLVGFYSDIADIKKKDSTQLAQKRAREAYNEEMMNSIPGSSKKIVQERYRAAVYEDPQTAFLPAWFLTFRYKDRPYTITINGQTGKTVGGVPWRKRLFVSLTTILSIIFTALISVVAVPFLMETDNISIFIFVIVFSIITSMLGIGKIRKVLAAIRRTTENSLVSFVDKRQKGE